MRSGEPAPARQAGFAYLMLLALVVVLGIAAGGAVMLGQSMSRRFAEEALLVAGDEFRVALASYRATGGSGPTELADLLRDPRVPGVRRHLRQVREDPLTGQADWGLLRDASGRIWGVHSLAEGEPIKRSGFAPWQAEFEEAPSYAQWRFGTPPAVAASAASAAASAPAPRRIDR